MFVYLFLLFLLLFGIFHFDIKKNVFLDRVYYFFLFIFFVLMTGLRFRVGGDSLLYENYYDIYPNLENYVHFMRYENAKSLNYQPLWLLLVAACKTIDTDYYFYQFIHSIIFNTVFFWFIKRNSKQPYTVLTILYVFLFYFYFAFDIQREILAICIFLLNYKNFERKRWVPYYLITVIAFLFHISAIILFILPLFRLIKFNKTFIVVTLLVSFPLTFGKTMFFDVVSSLLVTEAMKDRGKVYSEVEFSIAGVILFYTMRVILLLPYFFYYAKLQMKDKDWMFAAMLIFSVLSQVLVGTERFLNYIFIPYILFFVEFLYSLKFRTKYDTKKKIIITVCFLHLFCVLDYKLFFDKIGNKYYYSVFFPYGSVFEKERNNDRETFIINLWDK